MRVGKGYAAGGHYWIYPHQQLPPMGKKIHILTRGGVAIHSEWRWDAGFIAWQYLPLRDKVAEAECEQWLKERAAGFSSEDEDE